MFVGVGFLLGFAGVILGIPWFTRGSRSKRGSSLAGTIILALVLNYKKGTVANTSVLRNIMFIYHLCGTD